MPLKNSVENVWRKFSPLDRLVILLIVLLASLWSETIVEFGRARRNRGELAGVANHRINIDDCEVQQTFQNEFAWAQFTWDYSRKEWCVDAQRRTGEQVGACADSLSEAISQIEKEK